MDNIKRIWFTDGMPCLQEEAAGPFTINGRSVLNHAVAFVASVEPEGNSYRKAKYSRDS